jgi:hypothetical protein
MFRQTQQCFALNCRHYSSSSRVAGGKDSQASHSHVNSAYPSPDSAGQDVAAAIPLVVQRHYVFDEEKF